MTARRGPVLLLVIALIATACGSTADPVVADDCLVRIHGRTGSGAADALVDGVAELSPTGNDRFGSGSQWLYFGDDRYAEAREIVAATIRSAGCDRVVLNGFSNGAAFVAKLYCEGETFEGTLRGVVVDDPVTDTATVGCAPDADVAVALYWTGALDGASAPDTSCDDIGYTCQDGVLIGIDAMAANLGVSILASPFAEHRWYRDAPENRAFLDS